MIPIDTIVSIKSGDEYGGKYTGKLGKEVVRLWLNATILTFWTVVILWV